ncbi:hypothetical protein ODJ79_12005 [Actinoplanes sp. KI2]|uniref:hypothetical protein n=1 Tax=Actinoplanes sp. KI2 TaxID=2983315 RepID=UPI0021D5F523|nr:hypothetical protein [Actinoplanes sp. KI2]MCU7724441.1 hypothetical protein [Actinoplanes sp. KI2]
MASIDEEGVEIRVIHERDGAVIADTIPCWGDDGVAGQRWVDRNRDACVADGYQLIAEHEDAEQ